MLKPVSNIAFVANSNKPWVQDPSDLRFFSIKLKHPLNGAVTISEKNLRTGKYQVLFFDPDFVAKREAGRIDEITEDAIGLSSDGLVLWRFSTNTAPSSDVAYDNEQSSPSPAFPDRFLMGKDTSGKSYYLVDSDNVALIY